jgi:hypothetical protein
MEAVLFVSLLALSGLAWGIVYVAAIRAGLRDKTYAMPLFALGLNLSWEALYAVVSLTTGGEVLFQGFIDALWAVLDCGILYTYLRYGRFGTRWIFTTWTVAALVVSFALQLLFLNEFGQRMGSAYSAFLQNLLMSILFINMFVTRRGSSGQSLLIAVAKWIGTLAPTIAFGVLGHSVFFLVTGVLCSLFDLAYIAMLASPDVITALFPVPPVERRVTADSGKSTW